MKCIIPGANVKVFGRTVHSLSKIGEEIYFEPLETGLALRTVNSSRSAYACFIFAPTFFLHYDDGSGTSSSEDSEQDTLRCKIGVKSCLSVFKSLSTLEKTVDKCKISLDADQARLVFQLYCRHGIVKTYNLGYIECETLQAVFSKDLCPNQLTAQTKLLCDVVVNFQTNQEEVSLIITPERTRFKNYVEDEPDPTKVIHTELSLNPEEFDNYQVGLDTEVTFCLKELRAILSFGEPSNLPVSMSFETSGKPIVISIDSDPTFEANFVLATLADTGSLSQASTQQSTQARATYNTSASVRNTTQRTGSKSKQTKKQQNGRTASTSSGRKGAQSEEVTEEFLREASVVMMEGWSDDDMDISASTTVTDRHTSSSKKLQPTDHGNRSDNHNRRPSDSGDGPANHNQQTKGANLSSTSAKDTDKNITNAKKTSKKIASIISGVTEEICSPVIPVQQSSTFKPMLQDSDSEDEDEDIVPGTPPSKKFKSVFTFSSQSTTAGSQPKRTILAEDSETDSE